MSLATSFLLAYLFTATAGKLGITDIHELVLPIAVILAGSLAGLKD